MCRRDGRSHGTTVAWKCGRQWSDIVVVVVVGATSSSSSTCRTRLIHERFLVVTQGTTRTHWTTFEGTECLGMGSGVWVVHGSSSTGSSSGGVWCGRRRCSVGEWFCRLGMTRTSDSGSKRYSSLMCDTSIRCCCCCSAGCCGNTWCAVVVVVVGQCHQRISNDQ